MGKASEHPKRNLVESPKSTSLDTNLSTNIGAKDSRLLELLQKDYPQFRFCLNQKRFSFRFSRAPKNSSTNHSMVQGTIFIGPPQPNFALLALHELGHALCGHKDYNTHVQRLKIESAAWQRAKTVLENYEYTAHSWQSSKDQKLVQQGTALLDILPVWDQDFVEDSLDTYRDWLHAKSKCKKCGLTRYQTKDGKYHCPFCDTFTTK